LSDAPVAILNTQKTTMSAKATSNVVLPSPTAVGYPIDDAVIPGEEAESVPVDMEDTVEETDEEFGQLEEPDYSEGSSEELDAADPTLEGVPEIAEEADPTKTWAINAVKTTSKVAAKSTSKSLSKTTARPTSTKGSSFTKVPGPTPETQRQDSSARRIMVGLVALVLLL